MPETLIACEGGLDQRSASINAAKGTLSNCFNFEKDQGPGYSRRLGWVRYDGRITGPEIEDGVVALYNTANLTGVFTYGEQVRFASAGLPTLNAIYIGNSVSFGSYPAALLFAYPIQTFTNWNDITSYPTATSITGLSSGAVLTSLLFQPTLMNDSTISIPMYDNLKRATQRAHYLSVGAVPGRNESPVDAEFTFGNKSYAIHDCVTYTFTNGASTIGIVPVEGNVLVDKNTGKSIGTILAIQTTLGDWVAGTMQGQIVVYDYVLGQAFPSTGDQFDLYSADGLTKLVNNVGMFGSNLTANANNTRALLYSTYEQYVKDYTFGSLYGINNIINPPHNVPTPPTWSRPRLTRELPYTSVGLPAGSTSFGPTGSLDYSIYEYSRQGLTTQINQLSPIASPEKFPTIATDLSNGAVWVNKNNILVQDGAVANFPPIAANIGYQIGALAGSAFDFSSIPDNSVILGVVFRMRAQSSIAGNYTDGEIRLMSSAFPNGLGSQNKANGFFPPVGLTDRSYGSATDTWGEQITTAMLKDPSFGVSVRWKRVGTNPATTISVDAYAMTVYYVPPTRSVYVRDPTIVAAPAQDVPINIIHYCINSGDFPTQTAVGVLTVSIGNVEYQGTAAGKIRRLKAGDEIRTAASTPATNAANGTLLGYVTAEDYPTSFPPGAGLDSVNSRYEVIDANFWDTAEGRAAYIANGVEFATMFDGIFHVRIRTGRPTANDNPRHVAAHLNYLHLGFQSGSVVNTATGKPLTVLGTPGNGSSVQNFGEPINGMLTLNGQTLGVFTDRSTRGLQGTAPASSTTNVGYTPIMISPAINCIEYTLVNLVGEAVWTSYRGVETLRSVNAYGDFETLPLSAAAQKWLQGRIQVDLSIGSKPSRAVYAIGVRNKRQYRLFFADAYVYTLTLFDAGDYPVSTVQRLARPNATTVPSGVNDEPCNAGVIRHVYNGTRSDGKEIILASFENQNAAVVPAQSLPTQLGPYFPYAVRLDCGYSDDVQPCMPAFIEFNAIYAGYPTQSQQFGTITIFMNAYGGSQATIYTKMNFDGPIFDTAQVNQVGVLTAADFQVRKQLVTLPLIENRAYIPVPQRYMVVDAPGEGRMLKLRIDATQAPANFAPLLVPLRITHLSISGIGQDLDRT
jgi:hypothetical protein